MSEEERNAFVLRINPSGEDRVPEALEEDDLIIGWSKAKGLLTETDWKDFREILHETYYADEDTYRKAGSAAGNMWRFIHEMEEGDYVVVPHGGEFYVGRVAGPARREEDKVADDTTHRRGVIWLNDGEPIDRSVARAALQSRMKVWQTCARASGLVDEIEDALEAARSDEPPAFGSDLRRRLVEQALGEIRSGRLESYGFEELIAGILESLGGEGVHVVARSEDQGADILATYTVAETFQVTLAVQAKHHYRPEPPLSASVVEDLVEGMEQEDATHGWVVTAGTYEDEAEERRAQLEEERGLHLELIDGEQLAALVVEGGLRESVPERLAGG